MSAANERVDDEWMGGVEHWRTASAVAVHLLSDRVAGRRPSLSLMPSTAGSQEPLCLMLIADI